MLTKDDIELLQAAVKDAASMAGGLEPGDMLTYRQFIADCDAILERELLALKGRK